MSRGRFWKASRGVRANFVRGLPALSQDWCFCCFMGVAARLAKLNLACVGALLFDQGGNSGRQKFQFSIVPPEAGDFIELLAEVSFNLAATTEAAIAFADVYGT